MVTRALQDVLGWKIKASDPQGFVGAIKQAFQISTFEGHVESKWTPRSYAVQADLGGVATGAQASIFTMAKTLLGQMLPIVDGLYALDPAADEEYVAAVKQLVSSQLTNLAGEIGYLGGPRVMRVHQYFQMLFGGTVQLTLTPTAVALVAPPPTPAIPGTTTPINPPPLPTTLNAQGVLVNLPTLLTPFPSDPETVLGTLGDLRDLLGLHQTTTPGYRSYINTIDDEQNVTNFRIVVDYANSLWTAWSNSIQFFITTNTPFLGTQLVIVTRQLGVINETVDEVRFVLDSVFVGPAERQTIQVNFAGLTPPPSGFGINPFSNVPPIFLEDLLSWMQNFVTDEAPGIIQAGGKIALGEDFCSMIWELALLAWGAYLFAQGASTPAGLNTPRVQTSLQKLAAQLYELFTLAYPVGVSYLAPR
jgi:hypothetical protein